LGILFFLAGCTKPEVKPNVPVDNFVKGGDVSWLPQMEKAGYTFFDNDGYIKDLLQILKNHGMNTIRLRTFVNPSNDPINGHCSSAETVAMAVRAKKMGMRIMIDFHYSDSWADPGKQIKPTAWTSDNFSQLLDDLYNYTLQVMNDLKSAGVSPDWVQIGNEINPGMLLPDGSSDNMVALSQLINKGYDAIKTVSPQSAVIIHLSNGWDNALFRWFFDGLTTNNTRYDIIGMSYYPNQPYTASIDALSNNMNDMISRYGKNVMVVETGGQENQPDDTYNMVSAVIAKARAVAGGKALGVLYWEPEGAESWSSYKLSCWGGDGRPTKVLDAFFK